MSGAPLLDRIRGSLYGLAIGDALGAPVEGWSAARIRAEHGWISDFVQDEVAGTDDTEFAALTARILCRARGEPAPELLAAMWLEYCADWPERFDLMSPGGMSEKRAVANLLKGLLPPLSGRDHMANDSCGAAMRIAPCGLAAPGDVDLARRLARADASVSHWNEGVIQAEAIAAGVSAAAGGGAWAETVDAALDALPADSWTRRTVATCWEAARGHTDAPERAAAVWTVSDTGVPASHGPSACALALTALRCGEGRFADSVLLAVNAGRDCDSSAAQVGGIVGALVGFDGLPPHWVERIGPLPGAVLTPTRGLVLDDLAADVAGLAAELTDP